MSAPIDPPRMVHEDQLKRLMKLGAQRERDAVVSWLRHLGRERLERMNEEAAQWLVSAANAIGRGDHVSSIDPA